MALYLEKAWTRSAEDIIKELDVSAETGLSEAEAEKRRGEYGSNVLRETETKSVWEILINQFKSLIVVLLIGAGGLSFSFGDVVEGIAVVVVILINAAIGFITEWKAIGAMESLRKMGTVNTNVRRGGNLQSVSAELLVPGDIVVLEGGDVVTADMRLLTASRLQSDESALTGESVPVSKTSDVCTEGVPLAERTSMLYKGTALTRGSGIAVVVSTGMNTELGTISSLVAEADKEETPLEKRLNSLGNVLLWITLAIAAVIAVGGIIRGGKNDIILMIETAIALAVAAIPEGLPIVATLALARGMFRMARRNAVVNKLSAVETLGSTGVIGTDKTGTLTENRMSTVVYTFKESSVNAEPDGRFPEQDDRAEQLLRKALEVGVLCNNAELSDEESGTGDPLEIALLAAGLKRGIRQKDLARAFPEVQEEAFDSEIKMMATYNGTEPPYRVAVKGAPEEVLGASVSVYTSDGTAGDMTSKERELWISYNEKMAAEGLRVLALAEKKAESTDEKPYENLTLIGLVGLQDPPRNDVRDALISCRKAGIRVVMMTGDQKVTAGAIARAVCLTEEGNDCVIGGTELKAPEDLTADEKQELLATQVFARVDPKQKLDLIGLHQENGSVVAMTGDGVNDAPALKKADIGVAMGLRGTQVAKEAADMVLKDDSFATIVSAVEQGRIIFRNIQKFIVFLLSCNVSEVMTITIGSFLNLPLPLLPLQILFLNLVTDVFPALALGMGEGEKNIMDEPPRDPKESLISRRSWGFVTVFSSIITVSVLLTLVLAGRKLGLSEGQAITCSFLTLALSQLWHVFNMRDNGSGFFINEVTKNRFIWGSLLFCGGLLVAAVFVPGLSKVLKLENPGLSGWGLVLGMSLVPWVLGQVYRSLSGK